MAFLEATSVAKRYGGIVALGGVDFAAERGEVHALLGENGAGKSTFIQVLAGSVRPDAGSIRLGGAEYRPADPRAARAAGVAAVFQELSLVPDLTVAQNVWFRREPLSRLATARRSALIERTEALFARYRFPDIAPDREVRRLSLADRQVVEIAKALAGDPSVLILDEATSALAPRETEWLLDLARSFARSGRLVVFISHRLGEVRALVDRVTVFRNGETVGAYPIGAVSDETMIADMLGRRLDRLYPERHATATARLALKVRGLSAGAALKNVDLDLREGEVLGVAGLQGHGQQALFQALFGALRATGEVEVWGKPVSIRNPRRALSPALGLALVPEDRRGQGLLLSKSVRENLTLSVIPRFSRFGLLSARREKALVDEMIAFLQIKAKTPEQPAGTLSGGNQQKVIFGKMLLTEAKILLLFDPTRGVDVGTKGEIFRLMRDLAAKGYAILFYSSDLSEPVHVADRVAVMRNGAVAAVLAGEAVTEEGILRAAMVERAAA
ncbi:sugar ABC transporter ATP-binding protein [Prosthecomicrobium pneumaticum]|uniref:Ribose transport system ATP-binding protein n=1 Tax=Prosthecomicrobium pneumaticum TaxID=81895 RepID=A0A7W9CUM2_9HYPH|nr:sugar ABC transporter ATP-binding protein [Prosthecomicrobium pneumaticum]MBB5752197.1 ribose transport system ATP-binding protein [Prosthecomicrobium pneumaticum]